MATIDMAPLDGNGDTPTLTDNKKVYQIDHYVDFAAAATAKGSALAANDVIEVLNIPANTVILYGGIEVIDKMTGTSTDATIDVGITGVDVDQYVDGFDLDAGNVGTYASNGVQGYARTTVKDTIDVLIVTQTGTITGGKIRVFAVVGDLSAKWAPGIATLKS